MIQLTEEQQKVVNECYEMLKAVGLPTLEIGCPIPPKGGGGQ